jgi:hypothetical protein
LYDVIQEALTVHFQGLCFRERNAGHNIDAHMTDKGFNNQIGVNPETGEYSTSSKKYNTSKDQNKKKIYIYIYNLN